MTTKMFNKKWNAKRAAFAALGAAAVEGRDFRIVEPQPGAFSFQPLPAAPPEGEKPAPKPKRPAKEKPAKDKPPAGPRPIFRPGSKLETAFNMLARPEGATEAEVCAAIGWDRSRATIGKVAFRAGKRLVIEKDSATPYQRYWVK